MKADQFAPRGGSRPRDRCAKDVELIVLVQPESMASLDMFETMGMTR